MAFHPNLLFFFVSFTTLFHLYDSLTLKLEPTNAEVPFGISLSTALYDGLDTIYIVGGVDNGYPTGLMKYSLANNTVEKIGDIGELRQGHGVWTGDNEIYYFFLSSIWKIEPSAPENATSVQDLTYMVALGNTVVWDTQEYIYSFGGALYSPLPTPSPSVNFKYSKLTNAITDFQNMGGKSIINPSAVWDSRRNKAYIFGGYSLITSEYSEVLEFDPVTDSFTTDLNLRLPAKTMSSCAVWTGTDAYVLGGNEEKLSARYTPSSGTVEEIDFETPLYLVDHSCVWIEKLQRIYVFGGWEDHKNRISYIEIEITNEK